MVLLHYVNHSMVLLHYVNHSMVLLHYAARWLLWLLALVLNIELTYGTYILSYIFLSLSMKGYITTFHYMCILLCVIDSFLSHHL